MTKDRREHSPPVTADHRRQFEGYRYVYPVIARRSGGLSLGVNLNPDQRCNYSCVYCQVDRRAGGGGAGQADVWTPPPHTVDLNRMARELLDLAHLAASGEIWSHPRFAPTPQRLRRLNDIAFSGDGEPTCLADFDRAVAIAADVRRQLRLEPVKLVVITNATQLDSPQVQRALPILDANNGEIWAKLDAGTEEHFRAVNRPAPPVTLASILAGITNVARGRPIVIQTLLAQLHGQAPADDEIAAYCRNLQSILSAGGRIKLVQIHTVARAPAERWVAPLADGEVDALADLVRRRTGLEVAAFHGGF